MLTGLSGFSGAQFDFEDAGRADRTYIIASTYRSGSTHLCMRLWGTGVLGAPFEYLNYENEMRVLQSRFKATSPQDYLRKLMQHRTSANGVFGIKVHFPHFSAALRRYPELLSDLAPVQFIYIKRRDVVAQAVSLAKAFQTRAWLSLSGRSRLPLFYSTEFIQECLSEIRQQERDWREWFESKRIGVHQVIYEELCADESAAIEGIVKLMRAEQDSPSTVRLPQVESQFDRVNAEWIQRFNTERMKQDAIAG